mgnify:CR=1 FL=1
MRSGNEISSTQWHVPEYFTRPFFVRRRYGRVGALSDFDGADQHENGGPRVAVFYCRCARPGSSGPLAESGRLHFPKISVYSYMGDCDDGVARAAGLACVSNQSQPNPTKANQSQPKPTKANQSQPKSLCTNRNERMLTKANQSQSKWPCGNRNRPMPIKANKCPSKPIDRIVFAGLL